MNGRPAWQVALATTAMILGIGGGVWALADSLLVTEAEAAAPNTGFATKAECEKNNNREAKLRGDADARLGATLDRVVQTVDRIDKNQILIGERLRVRKLDRGE